MRASTIALQTFAGLQTAGALDFLVMGCWGGTSHSPYYTTQEANTAKSMNTEAQQSGANFAVALGDNFYSHGVTSENDPRFQQTFENVFSGASLSASSGFRFHVIAGNHDYLGDVDAQIRYSSHSARWNFPAKYYSFTETAGSATVQFIMIDPTELAGRSETLEEVPGCLLPGPANLTAAESQLAWLERTLAASAADYIVVSGHYPMYSVGAHGPTTKLHDTVQPLLRKYKVSAYLSAHDHNQQHIDVGDGVQYHVVGTSSIYVDSQSNIGTIPAGALKFFAASRTGGFASVHVGSHGLQLKHLDGNGKVLYTAPLQPSRSHVPTPAPVPTPSPTPTPTPAPSGSCSIGDLVSCLDGTNCAGKQCCRDGSICPSADNANLPKCTSGKASDCTVGPTPSPTPTPAPSGSCSIGDAVLCVDGTHCQGGQCCKDGTTCPSADNGNLPYCARGKASDCTVAGTIVA